MLDTTGAAAVARKFSRCLSPTALGGCECSITLSPPPNRPDPATYSQAPLVANNQPASWDSPDITFLVPPTYDGTRWQFNNIFSDPATVTIRNRSATVAAIDTLVTVSVARVGIGLARETIATQLISLAPGEVRQLPVPIRYYRAIDLDTDLGAHGFETGDGLVVDISHPYDAQTDNNHGESIIALIYRRRPVDSGGVPFADAIPIALGNPTAAAREYVLSVLPNSISAVVTPSHATVAPGALTHLPLNYVRPTNGGVDANVTIVARDPGGNLIGGMNVHFYFD